MCPAHVATERSAYPFDVHPVVGLGTLAARKKSVRLETETRVGESVGRGRRIPQS